MTRLALDHLTIVDSTPVELAQAAAANDCEGICLFMQSMDALPFMPSFNLIQDTAARRFLKRQMDDLGLTLELAYPFTLSGRTDVASFIPALECAAELKAQLLNVLIYDRDPIWRREKFAHFCELANSFNLRVALEFYPASQVRSLSESLEIVLEIDQPGKVGVNVDLLHLMRSGAAITDVANAPHGSVLFGQFADGPIVRPHTEWEFEASSDRLLAGEGDFDFSRFACALPLDCPVSVEIPSNKVLRSGLDQGERARVAINSVRNALAGDALPQPS